jgi:hypothetical protein
MTAPNKPLENALDLLVTVRAFCILHLSECPLCTSPIHSERLACDRGLYLAADLVNASEIVRIRRGEAGPKPRLRLVRNS